MLIDTITGVTSKLGIKALKPISALLFKVFGTGAASFLNAQLRADLYEGAKNQSLIPGISIAALAALKGRIDGTGIYINDAGAYYIYVQLSRGGGLNCQSGSYLNIELTNILTTHTIEVYGIEASTANGFPFRYNNLELNSDVSKQKFMNSNSEFEYLVMPQTNLVVMKQYKMDGGTPEYRPAELVGINMSDNEISYLNEASAATSKQALLIISDFLVVSVDDVKEWEIEKTAGQSYKYIAVDTALS